jgi:hypothetical protein
MDKMDMPPTGDKMDEMDIIDKIRKADKEYHIRDFLSFIEENKLLSIDLHLYQRMETGEIMPALSFFVVMMLTDSQYDRWCYNLKKIAQEKDRRFEYYLAFYMSDRDKLVEALCAIAYVENYEGRPLKE